MKFVEYSSIKNINDSKFIDKIYNQCYGDNLYIVLEKAHGANFAIYFDGKQFRCASRDRFLNFILNLDDENILQLDEFNRVCENSEGFFGYKYILYFILPRIVEYYKFLKNFEKIDQLIIYGELIGANYQHDDFKIINKKYNLRKVQKGVFYSPVPTFYIFDIKINNKYLGYYKFENVCARFFSKKFKINDNDNECQKIFKKYSICYAYKLFSGSLKDCIKFNNEYESSIPSILGLPKIDNNICEGNIIKPVNDLYLACGSRIILKNKNIKFAEKQKEKKNSIRIEDISEQAQNLLDILLTYVNMNRLNNVISHIGEVTINDFGNLMKELNKDILDDFYYYCAENNFDYLTKDEQKFLRKELNRNCANLIKEYFTSNKQLILKQRQQK
ncbi:MAG: RNA ligase family protein [Candidatus Pacearchaeota archaeon]